MKKIVWSLVAVMAAVALYAQEVVPPPDTVPTGGLIDLIAKWGGVAAAVVVLARVIVKLTPTPKDDSFLETIVGWLKHIGLKL